MKHLNKFNESSSKTVTYKKHVYNPESGKIEVTDCVSTTDLNNIEEVASRIHKADIREQMAEQFLDNIKFNGMDISKMSKMSLGYELEKIKNMNFPSRITDINFGEPLERYGNIKK